MKHQVDFTAHLITEHNLLQMIAMFDLPLRFQEGIVQMHKLAPGNVVVIGTIYNPDTPPISRTINTKLNVMPLAVCEDLFEMYQDFTTYSATNGTFFQLKWKD